MAEQDVIKTSNETADKMDCLCCSCELGKYNYEIDKQSPVCPYMLCNDGKSCSMYTELSD